MKKNEKIFDLITEIGKLRIALQKIEQMSDCGSYEKAIVNMKSIATDALKKQTL